MCSRANACTCTTSGVSHCKSAATFSSSSGRFALLSIPQHRHETLRTSLSRYNHGRHYGHTTRALLAHTCTCASRPSHSLRTLHVTHRIHSALPKHTHSNRTHRFAPPSYPSSAIHQNASRVPSRLLCYSPLFIVPCPFL